MTIIACFESTCPTCNRRILAGTEVSWTKGQKATHVVCPQATVEEQDDSLEARLSQYLETCYETKLALHDQASYCERRADNSRDYITSREEYRKSHFAAAQACAYRDVISQLERLLGR